MKKIRIRRCKGCGGDVTSRNKRVDYCYRCLSERAKWKLGQPKDDEKFGGNRIIQIREYKEYINSPPWRKKSNELKSKSQRCNLCFRSKKEVVLVTHHKTYLRCGAEFPDDLIVLCKDCHELFSKNYVYRQLQGYHEPREKAKP